MFSFHRPKVYRSPTGCCICKAKSSSSRFTDSKKYEEDFLECFKLVEPRQGEICNACVLLVKRWKKLPAGSNRNWKHVVDARAGPGMKSMSKFKSKKKNFEAPVVVVEKNKIKKKHFDREFSPALSDKSGNDEDVEMADVDFLSEENPSGGSSRTESPGASDCDDTVVKSRRHKGQAKRRQGTGLPEMSDFVDSDYWKKESICCGFIFRGLLSEIMVDYRFLKPCTARLAQCKLQRNVNTGNGTDSAKKVDAEASSGKVFSDSSSDSGYDESSNQGATTSTAPTAAVAVETAADSAFKKDQVSIEDLSSQQIPQNN